jgi:hypothetical protein
MGSGFSKKNYFIFYYVIFLLVNSMGDPSIILEPHIVDTIDMSTGHILPDGGSTSLNFDALDGAQPALLVHAPVLNVTSLNLGHEMDLNNSELGYPDVIGPIYSLDSKPAKEIITSPTTFVGLCLEIFFLFIFV